MKDKSDQQIFALKLVAIYYAEKKTYKDKDLETGPDFGMFGQCSLEPVEGSQRGAGWVISSIIDRSPSLMEHPAWAFLCHGHLAACHLATVTNI